MGKAWTKYGIFLTLLCLCVCVLLGVGVAYGRYQWEFPRRSYVFAPELPDNIYMCGSVPGEWLDHGNLPELSKEWIPTNNGVKLDFGVTNGDADHISQREQSYVIRLVTSLSVEDPEKLSVILYWWDAAGEIHWATGVPVPIQEGSMLHASHGDGWVYQFRTERGEVGFSLPGGQLAYANHTIAVTGEVPATMMDVQVLGQTPEE